MEAHAVVGGWFGHRRDDGATGAGRAVEGLHDISAESHLHFGGITARYVG